MNRLYTYILTSDTGLAPNPFWGWCTLAVCTPNHQGSPIQPGDWIAGFLGKAHGHKLVYAMQVAERIHMNDYFHDPRFAAKKPRIHGTPRQRCGDNLYSQSRTGAWSQLPTTFHATIQDLTRDTKHPWVFVTRRFWYLGRQARPIPPRYLPLVGGRGTRVNHPPTLAANFTTWVQSSLSPGIAALPRDFAQPLCDTPHHRGCA